MQNSLWKLISIVGVIAIGTLVVLEVQKGLSSSDAFAQNESDTPAVGDSARSVTPETKPSEFERQLLIDQSSAVGEETGAGRGDDRFNEMFADEPDLGGQESVDVAVDRTGLTDNVDPFAREPLAMPDDFPGAAPVAKPAQTVSFADEREANNSGEFDPFDFGTESDDGNDGEIVDSFEFGEVELSLPDSGSDEFNTSDLAQDPYIPDAVSSAAISKEPRSDGVNSLMFLPRRDEAETVGVAGHRQPDDSAAADSSSIFDDSFEAEPLGPVEDLLDLTDANGEFGDDSALRPTPRPPAEDPTSFSNEVNRLPEAVAVRDDPAVEPEVLMFGAEDVKSGDSLPFFEEPSERNSDLNAVRDRTSSARSRTPTPDVRDDVAFDDPGPVIPTREPEFPEFDFNDAPVDPVLPRTEEAPGRHFLSPEPDREEKLRDSPRLRSEPAGRRDFDMIDIRPRGGRQLNDAESSQRLKIRPAQRGRRIPSSSTADSSTGSADSSTGVLRPHLTVRKQMPKSATLGRPLNYTLVVTNEGRSPARDVIVEDVVPVAASVDAVEPTADYEKETRKLIWRFEELGPGESRELKVQLTPTEQGVLSSVATVRFNAQVTTSTFVTAPKLTLELTTPGEVRVGGETQLRFLVRNEGDGTATDVILRSDLPAGLSHPQGNDLEYVIETLKPDEQREIVLTVVAAEPGRFTSQAELLAEGISGDTAEAAVNVIGQQIQLVRRGPKRRYVGRTAQYENILSNETAFAASGISVTELIPKGMEFKNASPGHTYSPQRRSVVWRLDRIDPGETETLTIELTAVESGDQESSVTVVENAGFETGAKHVTAVEDLHNIGVRMSRLNGPVSMSEEFGFDIAVKNRGTADATAILLTIDLPDGVQGVSVGKDGPRADPDIKQGHLQYHFQPVKRIKPGDEMIYRINLKATEPLSNGVVNARIRYDQMQKELVTSEAITASDDRP